MSEQNDIEMNDEVDERVSSNFLGFIPNILESQEDQDEINNIKYDIKKKVARNSLVCSFRGSGKV